MWQLGHCIDFQPIAEIELFYLHTISGDKKSSKIIENRINIICPDGWEYDNDKFNITVKNYILIKNGDYFALANWIIELKDNEEIRKKYGKQGRNYLIKYATTQKIVEKYKTIINRNFN